MTGPTHRATDRVTVVALTAIVSRRFVGYDGGYATTAGGVHDMRGVSEANANAGDALPLITAYSAPVEVAQAIPEGSWVRPAADGSGRAEVGTQADGCGRALSGATVAGDRVEVRLLERAPGGFIAAQAAVVALGIFTEAALYAIDTTGLAIGTEALVSGLLSVGSVRVKWNGTRWIPATPVTVFSSGAGWSRVFNNSTDTTKVVLLAVRIPRVLMHEATVLKITHYWSEVGSSTKNIVLGISNTNATNSFYLGQPNSGVGFFSVQEVYFTNGMVYPQSPNQTYGSGAAAAGPATIVVDFEQEQELLFYAYANGNLTNESVSLCYVKLEVL